MTPIIPSGHNSLSNAGNNNQFGVPELTVLHESSVCRSLLSENFQDICSSILAQRTSRSIYVQATLPKILPRLAAFNRDKFIQGLVMSLNLTDCIFSYDYGYY